MRYSKYKNTNVSWMPEIPATWDWLLLSQTAKEQCVKKPAGDTFDVMSLSYGNVIHKKNIDAGLVPANYDNYQVIRPGNIILRLTDLQNDHTSLRTGLVKYTGIITSAYTCIAPTGNAAYLHYILYSYDTRKVFYGMGGGVRQSIGYKDIRNMRIPVPSREEQGQIVRYLDWQVSKINKLIAAKKKQIALLQENILIGLYNVITNGLNSCHNIMQTSSPWIKSMPAHWKIVAVRRNYYSVLGKMLASVPQNVDDTPEYYFCAKDVHFNIAGKTDLKKMWFSTYEKEIYRVANGDLLVVEGGAGAGGAAVAEISCGENIYIQNSIHRVRPKNNNASNKFLCYWLYCLQKRGYIDYVCNVATIPHFTHEKLLMTEMPFPPYAEQLEIVNYLDISFSKYDKATNLINEEITALRQLRTCLISDVVTGQVDVRGIKIQDFEYVDETNDDDDNEGTETEAE